MKEVNQTAGPKEQQNQASPFCNLTQPTEELFKDHSFALCEEKENEDAKFSLGKVFEEEKAGQSLCS